ncbi:hypothetical protein SPSIL_004930 [Sporomusa silvacetica DSM 10669]|uniref:Uncharacterized protein n=1 Tax=Sporomusa silvacetica DSM 10669 TaxID=1123289 RepID=A0ABZ3IFH6_9FIRM|nr:hypothetical protein SPSIL_53170 [Sporomusa silvacetica DSM 10669]
MNRREFLQRTFGACSTIWLGQNFLEVCSAIAKEQSVKLLNSRSGLENLTGSYQNYFWIELAIWSAPEIILSQNPYEFLLLIKKCQAGKGRRDRFIVPISSPVKR